MTSVTFPLSIDACHSIIIPFLFSINPCALYSAAMQSSSAVTQMPSHKHQSHRWQQVMLPQRIRSPSTTHLHPSQSHLTPFPVALSMTLHWVMLWAPTLHHPAQSRLRHRNWSSVFLEARLTCKALSEDRVVSWELNGGQDWDPDPVSRASSSESPPGYFSLMLLYGERPATAWSTLVIADKYCSRLSGSRQFYASKPTGTAAYSSLWPWSSPTSNSVCSRHTRGRLCPFLSSLWADGEPRICLITCCGRVQAVPTQGVAAEAHHLYLVLLHHGRICHLHCPRSALPTSVDMVCAH